MRCLTCNKKLPENKVRRNAKFCNSLCRGELTKIKYRSMNDRYNLATGTIGTIGELKVSIDLLIKGYEVFRALSPSCSCDLAILKNNELKRIEVRTGSYTPTGKIMFTKKLTHKIDHFAIILKDKIIYQPSLE